MTGGVGFCSGQSNMTIPVKQAWDPQTEIAAANHPNRRFLHLNYNMEHMQNRPRDDISANEST